MSKKFVILDSSGGKTAAQKYDLMSAYFRNKVAFHGRTTRYAPDGSAKSPRITLADGRLAFPVMGRVEQFLSNSPYPLTMMTYEEIAPLLARNAIDDRINPQAETTRLMRTTAFVKKHKGKLAAATAAAAGIGSALYYYFS